MSLENTLNAVANAAPTCRIEKLLNTIDVDDALTLRGALINRNVKAAILTQALRKEYGHDAVADKSVGTWRSRNLTDLTGL